MKINQYADLFESVIEKLYEQTTPPASPNPQGATPPAIAGTAAPVAQNATTSMAEYFQKTFLDNYLEGIPNSQYMKPKIDNILKNLPELYRTKKLEAALEDLANLAWTLGTGPEHRS